MQHIIRNPNQGKHALIVDDDPDFLATLEFMLPLCGLRFVSSAPDGLIALDYLDEWQFDLIISDWNMGIMDGIELLQKTRLNPFMARTPFILMTASLTETAWRGAIEHGATEFLIKPFGLEALRSACQLCLKLRLSREDNVISLEERLRLRRYHV